MFSRRSDVSVSQPLVYDIRVAGALPSEFSDYVRGMTITSETAADGGPVTIVRGVCPDHAALVGVLNTLGNFGLAVLSVRCLGVPDGEAVAQSASSEELKSDAFVEVAQAVPPVAAAATAAVVAPAAVAASSKFLSRLRPGGYGGVGAGTGLIVGGLLTVGGPPCILAGAVAGAVIGSLAASLLGKTVREKK